MIKLIAFVYKRPDMSRDEFLRYWRETHGPLMVKSLPDMRRYIQNHVRPEASQGAAVYDDVAELWFDDLATLQAAFNSSAAQEMLATVASAGHF
jgi:uncharacterized protein (TIGR02118 family)